ncbi:hypothetical protein K3495_g9488 [Podosphaera aphanis]|nr:hypothetical protein K3495_g9488 [Podosphaera aphanis]
MNIENAFLSETLVSVALFCEDIPIPRSYKQAIADLKYGKMWKKVIDEEIQALTLNQIWEEVFLKPDGTLDRFKARLVARGFTQRFGTDYKETFAPTVQMATLRAFLAICAAEDLELFHFDIKNAFTEASPDASLFLRAPKGIQVKPCRGREPVAKENLLEWGFIQSLADPCLFANSKRNIKILVYVDDIATAAKSTTDIEWLSRAMNGCFNTKNLGEMKMFLGMRITWKRKEKTIWLDQQQYLERTLTKFGIPNAKH